MTAGNSAFCDGLTVLPCTALLFGGSRIQFLFFPGEGHHHLAIGYDADAFIFPVGAVLLPRNKLKIHWIRRGQRRGDVSLQPDA